MFLPRPNPANLLSMSEVKQPQVPVFSAPVLADLLPGVVCGFSGNLSYDSLATYPSAVEHVLDPLGVKLEESVFLAQPHGPEVLFFGKNLETRVPRDDNGFLVGFDGAASTMEAGGVMTVRSADCVPILAVDPESGGYAALHAGWRGTAAGILPNLLQGWSSRGSSLSQVKLALGPGIAPCCFEVGSECLAAFSQAHLVDAVMPMGDRFHLDLHRVLITQATHWGVASDHIETLSQCTRCYMEGNYHPLASYRRAQQQGTPTEGRNVSFIGIARS